MYCRLRWSSCCSSRQEESSDARIRRLTQEIRPKLDPKDGSPECSVPKSPSEGLYTAVQHSEIRYVIISDASLATNELSHLLVSDGLGEEHCSFSERVSFQRCRLYVLSELLSN